MTATSTTLSPDLQSLLDIYQSRAEDLVFPGICHASLQELVDELSQRATKLSEAEAALVTAQEELGHARKELDTQARAALAYAKVFAGADPELASQLDALKIAGTKGKEKKVKRSKGSKAKAKPKSENNLSLEFAESISDKSAA